MTGEPVVAGEAVVAVVAVFVGVRAVAKVFVGEAAEAGVVATKEAKEETPGVEGDAPSEGDAPEYDEAGVAGEAEVEAREVYAEEDPGVEREEEDEPRLETERRPMARCPWCSQY
jgi:hypothetical protein